MDLFSPTVLRIIIKISAWFNQMVPMAWHGVWMDDYKLHQYTSRWMGGYWVGEWVVAGWYKAGLLA